MGGGGGSEPCVELASPEFMASPPLIYFPPLGHHGQGPDSGGRPRAPDHPNLKPVAWSPSVQAPARTTLCPVCVCVCVCVCVKD